MTAPAMFEVRIETRLSASHRCDPEGRTVPSHTHEWTVAVTARSSQLDRIAIVVDFRKLRADTDRLLAELSGDDIEEHRDFAAGTASPIDVAQWILARLGRSYETKPYRVAAVTVGCDPGISFTVTGESTG